MAAGDVRDTGIRMLVEKQMRNWELARAQRLARRPVDRTREVEDFVAISRALGCGGTEVARLLGERLGWPVFDREILRVMAGDDRIRERIYESLDEHDTSWLDAALRWILRGDLPRQDYFHRLSETILTLARQGHAIFLGRAADLILPRQRGLRVRLTAPPERCAARLAQREGIALEQARRRIERIEREREDFVRHHFENVPPGETRFDLTINLDGFTAEQAVAIVSAAMTARGIRT